MTTNILLNSTIIKIENEDMRYQSCLYVKDRYGKIYLITATNSRKFLISEVKVTNIDDLLK